MTNEIEKVKGFRDILPPESLKRTKVKSVIEENFRLFGFIPIETPTIEYDSLLRGDNESDEAVSDRFRLQDKGKRELGLRFEFTVQLSRIFKENSTIKLPFRRYQIGNNFRDEPLRQDRYREFIQCDADILGDATINADAECLALGSKILKDLGIKAEIKVNNRKLLNSMLEKIGIESSQQQQVLREIDKLDKLGEKEVKINLSKVLMEKQIKELFLLLGKDLDYFVKQKFNGVNEIYDLQKLGKTYDYKIVFTPTLMRGFSYYTGNVWEIFSKEKKVALASGGRYDDKVGKYCNRQIPAVGISFGTLVDYDKVEVESVKYVLISLEQDKLTIDLASKLRNSGKSCVVFYGKPSKALDWANAYGAENVIFIGAEEVKKKKFKVKNLKSGKEIFIGEKELIGK